MGVHRTMRLDIRYSVNPQVRSEYVCLRILLRRRGIQDANITRLISSYLVTSLADMGFDKVRYISSGLCQAMGKPCALCARRMRVNKGKSLHPEVVLCVNCKSAHASNGGNFVQSFLCGACCTWYETDNLRLYSKRYRSQIPADLAALQYCERATEYPWHEHDRQKRQKRG